MKKISQNIFVRFLPFWAFLVLFKFAGGLHYVLMPPFGEHFMPVWTVGVLIGGASFIQLLLDVPSGYLLDRFGYVLLFRVSTFTFFLAALCIAIGLTEITYFASVFLSIFGWLFFTPGVDAYSLSQATPAAEGKLFSLRDIFGSVGIVLGSITLPFALLLPIRMVGVVLCVLFFLAFIALSFVPPEQKMFIAAGRKRRGIRKLLGSIRKLNPASGMLLLLTLSAAIFYGIIWFAVPLVIATQQANAGLMGLGLGVFDFSVVVLGYLIGWMADRLNHREMVFFGLLIFSVMGMLTGVQFGWFFIFFGFFATAGEEMAGISLWSWMHKLDAEHTADGTVSGVISLFHDLGWAIGPVAAGILYTLVGPSLAITLGALPILLVWIVYYFFVHPHFPYEALEVLIPYRPRTRKHKA